MTITMVGPTGKRGKGLRLEGLRCSGCAALVLVWDAKCPAPMDVRLKYGTQHKCGDSTINYTQDESLLQSPFSNPTFTNK